MDKCYKSWQFGIDFLLLWCYANDIKGFRSNGPDKLAERGVLKERQNER